VEREAGVKWVRWIWFRCQRVGVKVRLLVERRRLPLVSGVKVGVGVVGGRMEELKLKWR
jgi:hypothetical protein